MILKLILVLVVVGYVVVLEVDIQRSEVTYTNPKYVEYMNVSVKRLIRRGPHYFNMELVILQGYGDNLTVNFVLNEQISSRYVPTGIDVAYRLCDFIHNEPYLGKMLAKQVPYIKCPGQRGKIILSNITSTFEKLPVKIPFLLSRPMIAGRGDFNFYVTKTKERVAEIKVYVTLSQNS